MESDSPAAADLTRTEALLFDALRSRPGVVWTRRELLEAMHGKTRGNVQEHAVDMMVARLRKSLGAAGGCIETVRCRGLRWNPAHLAVDRETRTAFVGGLPVDLALSERAVLAALASRPGRIFSPEKLAASLSLSEPTIRSVVASLRRKLGAAGDFVETVHGRGYRFGPKRRASAWRIAAAGGALLALLAVVGLALVVADGRGTARTETSLGLVPDGSTSAQRAANPLWATNDVNVKISPVTPIPTNAAATPLVGELEMPLREPDNPTNKLEAGHSKTNPKQFYFVSPERRPTP